MTLDKQREVWYYNKALDSCITCGGVAHLGERLNGIQEVVGSIPIVSTKKQRTGLGKTSVKSSSFFKRVTNTQNIFGAGQLACPFSIGYPFFPEDLVHIPHPVSLYSFLWKNALASSKVIPSRPTGGEMTITWAPTSWAADSFSANPPGPPVFLVTRMLHPV